MDDLPAVAVGALLAFIAAIAGAWLQARREHRRWIRERRFEAYVDVVKMNNLAVSAGIGSAALARNPSPGAREEVARMHVELTRRMPDVIAVLEVLGPKSVVAIADRVLGAINEGDQDTSIEASDELSAAMRKVLRITDAE